MSPKKVEMKKEAVLRMFENASESTKSLQSPGDLKWNFSSLAMKHSNFRLKTLESLPMKLVQGCFSSIVLDKATTFYINNKIIMATTQTDSLFQISINIKKLY